MPKDQILKIRCTAAELRAWKKQAKGTDLAKHVRATLNGGVPSNSAELTPSHAYTLGRVDALAGQQPTRFSQKPFSGTGPTPLGHCACYPSEAKIWDTLKQQYLLGFDIQSKSVLTPAKVRN